MASQLFSPLALGGLQLNNRVVVSPMCQYSATDGNANDWHLMHLGQYAVSGGGLLLTEATGVTPEGRISPRCLSLCSDDNEAALRRVVDFTKAYGNVPIGIQLAHAGRKAATLPPWRGGTPAGADDGGWQTVAPSAVPYDAGWPAPVALGTAEIDALIAAWVAAARRAAAIGFDVAEVHSAHGYLLHHRTKPLSRY